MCSNESGIERSRTFTQASVFAMSTLEEGTSSSKLDFMSRFALQPHWRRGCISLRWFADWMGEARAQSLGNRSRGEVADEALIMKGAVDDPQTQFRQLSLVFPKGRSSNRPAQESWNVSNARRCRETRARRAVSSSVTVSRPPFVNTERLRTFILSGMRQSRTAPLERIQDKFFQFNNLQ